MTRGQRILLWAVVVGAFVVGLLHPLLLASGPGWLIDARQPRLTTTEKAWRTTQQWASTFVSRPVYPISVLVGVIAAYRLLGKNTRD